MHLSCYPALFPHIPIFEIIIRHLSSIQFHIHIKAGFQNQTYLLLAIKNVPSEREYRILGSLSAMFDILKLNVYETTLI